MGTSDSFRKIMDQLNADRSVPHKQRSHPVEVFRRTTYDQDGNPASSIDYVSYVDPEEKDGKIIERIKTYEPCPEELAQILANEANDRRSENP